MIVKIPAGRNNRSPMFINTQHVESFHTPDDGGNVTVTLSSGRDHITSLTEKQFSYVMLRAQFEDRSEGVHLRDYSDWTPETDLPPQPSRPPKANPPTPPTPTTPTPAPATTNNPTSDAKPDKSDEKPAKS